MAPLPRAVVLASWVVVLAAAANVTSVALTVGPTQPPPTTVKPRGNRTFTGTADASLSRTTTRLSATTTRTRMPRATRSSTFSPTYSATASKSARITPSASQPMLTATRSRSTSTETLRLWTEPAVLYDAQLRQAGPDATRKLAFRASVPISTISHNLQDYMTFVFVTSPFDEPTAITADEISDISKWGFSVNSTHLVVFFPQFSGCYVRYAQTIRALFSSRCFEAASFTAANLYVDFTVSRSTAPTYVGPGLTISVDIVSWAALLVCMASQYALGAGHVYRFAAVYRLIQGVVALGPAVNVDQLATGVAMGFDGVGGAAGSYAACAVWWACMAIGITMAYVLFARFYTGTDVGTGFFSSTALGLSTAEPISVDVVENNEPLMQQFFTSDRALRRMRRVGFPSVLLPFLVFVFPLTAETAAIFYRNDEWLTWWIMMLVVVPLLLFTLAMVYAVRRSCHVATLLSFSTRVIVPMTRPSSRANAFGVTVEPPSTSAAFGLRSPRPRETMDAEGDPVAVNARRAPMLERFVTWGFGGQYEPTIFDSLDYTNYASWRAFFQDYTPPRTLWPAVECALSVIFGVTAGVRPIFQPATAHLVAVAVLASLHAVVSGGVLLPYAHRIDMVAVVVADVLIVVGASLGTQQPALGPAAAWLIGCSQALFLCFVVVRFVATTVWIPNLRFPPSARIEQAKSVGSDSEGRLDRGLLRRVPRQPFSVVDDDLDIEPDRTIIVPSSRAAKSPSLRAHAAAATRASANIAPSPLAFHTAASNAGRSSWAAPFPAASPIVLPFTEPPPVRELNHARRLNVPRQAGDFTSDEDDEIDWRLHQHSADDPPARGHKRRPRAPLASHFTRLGMPLSGRSAAGRGDSRAAARSDDEELRRPIRGGGRGGAGRDEERETSRKRRRRTETTRGDAFSDGGR